MWTYRRIARLEILDQSRIVEALKAGILTATHVRVCAAIKDNRAFMSVLVVRISAIFDLSLSSGMRATSWACLDSCCADHFGISSRSSKVYAADTVSAAYFGG